MSKTVTWKYKGDADVVFGEVHISKAPKIILAVTVITVIVACVTGFLLRDYIYDVLTNPQIILKNVSQDENGYFIEIPYAQDNNEFVSTDYIDTVNTREYESFTNPDISAYSYTIDGNVDVNTIGEYTVNYNSKNRVRHNTTTLTVRVKDITGPVITLKNPKDGKELSKTSDGIYYGITVHRNTDEVTNFNVNDYILAINDNCSELSDITILYPDVPDFNGNKEDNIIITYTATDTSGNTSETSLKLLIMDKPKNSSMDIAGLVDKKEQEQQLVDQTTNNNNNDQNNPGTDTGTGPRNSDIDPNDDDSWRADNWQDTPTNDDGTHVGRNPQISADSFTWSISRDGTIDMCIAMASVYVHYYDYDGSKAKITSGPGITYQLEGPGTYTFHWETSTGLSCDQTVTITE